MDSASINPFACRGTLQARADRLLSFDLVETVSNHLAYMITPDPPEGYFAERIRSGVGPQFRAMRWDDEMPPAKANALARRR
jgi:hypothetical protein